MQLSGAAQARHDWSRMKQICIDIDLPRGLLITVICDSGKTSPRKGTMVSERKDVFRLYLLRHAHAAWASPGSRDFDRALDRTGLAEARSVALQAFTAGLVPDVIISSPARRCAETTEALLDRFGHLEARFDERLYSEGMDAYLDHILAHRDASSLMLVGHNPMIEGLSSMLSRPGDIGGALAYGYPTAGLLALDFPRPLAGDLSHRGEPVLMLTPALT